MSTTGMAPLERKAAFKAAVTLHQLTAAEAARLFKISYNHLMLVLSGDRKGSQRVRHAIAAFLGRTDIEVFGIRVQRVAPEAPISSET